MTIRPRFHRTLPRPPVCRDCGCDDTHPCTTTTGPCYWVEPDLCSACEHPAVPTLTPHHVEGITLTVTGTIQTRSGIMMTPSGLTVSRDDMYVYAFLRATDPRTQMDHIYSWSWNPRSGLGWNEVPASIQQITPWYPARHGQPTTPPGAPTMGVRLRTCTNGDETALLTVVAEDMINYALRLRAVVGQAVVDLRGGTPTGPVADRLQAILDDEPPGVDEVTGE